MDWETYILTMIMIAKETMGFLMVAGYSHDSTDVGLVTGVIGLPPVLILIFDGDFHKNHPAFFGVAP